MMSQAEYALTETISDTASASLVRAIRTADGQRVVLKLAHSEYPRPEELSKLRHEYALLRSLDLPGVLRTYGLATVNGRLALVLEDLGGRSLDLVSRAGRIELPHFLDLAVALAKIVESIHREGILHKDLKPEHFFVDERTAAIKLIDFGLATRLPRERPRIVPTSLEGTFVYMSPEQTGRMNRSVDQRSDLYSLGVTLYELLTGSPPFTSADPLELVHSHIARTPVSPSERRPDVPRAVSAIVLKLLAKVAEDRYQDAGGLAADLQHCSTELRARDSIAPFLLGRHDAAGVLRVPQKLYGRDAEIAALLAAFERSRGGAAELMLVGGPSGGGKSVLVHELQKQLVRRGRFIAGKCDPQNRTPYASIAQACRGLLTSILAEPPRILEAWSIRLRDALGPGGAVLVPLLPELELAIGKLPPAIELEPSAAQHRFEQTFQRFVQVFSSEEHPLVMFLDDLQWADSASQRLLHVLLTAPERGHLLVLGAYRDNEVGPAHELTLALAELRAGGATTTSIGVSPLGHGHVRQLIADALSDDPERLGDPLDQLATLVLDKTAGNPFFIGQFLGAIVDQGLLKYDAEAHSWRFDLHRITTVMVTDNVVELLVARLHRLGPQTLAMLRVAACVGHRFDLETLAAVSGRTAQAVAQDLWEALQAGLLVPLDERYRYQHLGESEPEPQANIAYQFLHDRVQQAAYSLADSEQHAAVHLQIGRWLLTRCTAELPDESLFEVVGHLNLGARLMGPGEERRQLARLNLRAGTRARDSAAYAAAIKLLSNAIDLIGESGWHTDYDVAYAAHVLSIECEAATGRTAPAFTLLTTLDRCSAPGLDRAAGRRLEAAVLTQLNRLPEAIVAGAAGAVMLGTELPLEPNALAAATQAEFGAVQQALAGRAIASLADLPLMTDPRALATSQIFATLLPATLQTRPELLALLLCKAIGLSLKYGNPPAAPHFYTSYAYLHALITGDHLTAHQFGLLGVGLGERPAHRQRAGAGELVFASFVAHWHSHVSESLAHYQRGLRASLEVSDFIHYGYCTTHGALMRLYTGGDLDALAEEVRHAEGPIRNAGDHINASLLRCVERAIETLQAAARSPGRDPGSRYDTDLDVAGMQANPTLLGMHLIAKTMALYFAGEIEAAMCASDEAERILAYQRGMFWSVEHAFYRALLRAELVRRCKPSERTALLAALENDTGVLRGLAASAPVNHAHRVALITAEHAAIGGESGAAIDAFDRAIALAHEHDFHHHEALANELCANFHLAAGRAKVGRVYLLDAYAGYRSWGARVKLQALRARHGEIVSATEANLTIDSRSMQGTSATIGGLDLATAVRMTQAIASELMRDKLIERLMRSLVEHAGAQRGFLIVPNGEHLELHASVTVDPDHVRIGLTQPLDTTSELSGAVVRYVARSREAVILADAAKDARFNDDPYMLRALPKSVLCVAMEHHGRLRGVIYLENNAATAVFDPARIELLRFLAAQAAIAIENATLYEELEQRVRERTAALAATNERLKISLKELGDAQRNLIDMSRRAGMADVATSILHDVGNVLTTINVSAQTMVSLVQRSKSAGIGKLAQLLEEHRADVVRFLAEDERGRLIPEYLVQLAAHVAGERASMLEELQTLQKNIEHVAVVVAMQQTHAKGGEVAEKVELQELLNDAIRLGGSSLQGGDVELICDCEEPPSVSLDRHKLLQILLNLLRNARDAVCDAADRGIVLRYRTQGERVVITVEDRGVGIAEENLQRIFHYGFTTKPHGHGFGLHSSALAASELGGSLSCMSAGLGQGATFVLELPRRADLSRLAS